MNLFGAIIGGTVGTAVGFGAGYAGAILLVSIFPPAGALALALVATSTAVGGAYGAVQVEGSSKK